MNEAVRPGEFEPAIDQFSAWRTAIATGKRCAYERGAPTAGYFKRKRYVSATDRTKVYDAVAIWQEDDEWICVTSGGFTPMGLDAIEDLFVSINSQPISFELFEAIMAGGAWPDAVAEVEAPAADLAPHEAAAAELTAQQESAKEWLHALGHKPQTQSEADRAANFANEFAKIEKRVIGLHEVEKRPVIDHGKAIDAKWFVTRDAAKAAKAWAKGLSDDFAIAESARRRREADEENARRRREFEEAQTRAAAEARRNADLTKAGVRMPEAAPPIEPPKAVAEPVRVGTTGKRQSLRSFTTYEIADATALLRFLAERNVKSAKLLDAALADARALHEVGTEVPGLKVGTEEKMV